MCGFLISFSIFDINRFLVSLYAFHTLLVFLGCAIENQNLCFRHPKPMLLTVESIGFEMRFASRWMSVACGMVARDAFSAVRSFAEMLPHSLSALR